MRALSVLLLLALAAVAFALPEDRVIVKYKDGIAKQRGLHERFGGRHIETLNIYDHEVEIVKFSDEEAALAAIGKYTAVDEVEYAEIDGVMNYFTNDARYNELWSFTSSHWDMPTVWSTFGVDGSGVTVCVVDTGADKTHPDLTHVILEENLTDDYTDGNLAWDNNNHGTHCSGTIGARKDNGEGIVGVAPGATLINYKVLKGQGGGYNSWIASGIQKAHARGCDVISLSLGGPSSSSVVTQAVANAKNAGVHLICAAGNDGPGAPTSYPAAEPGCIGIGNHDSSNNMHSSSSRGNWVDVAAPGSQILSSVWNPTHGYSNFWGTSMATPHVAGLVALMVQRDPSITPDRVKEILIQTSWDRNGGGYDINFGHGIVKAYDALNAVSPANPPPPPPGNPPNPPPPNFPPPPPPPPTSSTPDRLIANGQGIFGPFRQGRKTSNTRFPGDGFAYNLWIDNADSGYLEILADNSDYWDSNLYESLEIYSKGAPGNQGSLYIFAINSDGSFAGQYFQLSTSSTTSYTKGSFLLSDLAPNGCYSIILWAVGPKSWNHLDSFVLKGRPATLGQARALQPPREELVATNTNTSVTMTPRLLSAYGEQAMLIKTEAKYISGESSNDWELESVVGGAVLTSITTPLVREEPGTLKGISPILPVGSHEITVYRDGEDYFGGTFTVEVYDCTSASTCQECVENTGPQCVWCGSDSAAPSCHDIRGTTCPLEAIDAPCEVIEGEVTADASARSFVYGLLLVAILALFF